jgi:N-acetylglucosamine-6-phosphate deacetylase
VLLAAGRVVTPARILAPGWVHVDGDRIIDVGAGEPPRAADVSLPAATLVPGFVDSHVHGGGGASFDSGDPEDAATAVRAHRAHGTTTMIASLVTERPEVLAASVRGLADLVEDGLLAGIHLEGPWLSPRYAGAHDPDLLTDPAPHAVDTLLEAGRGHVRMVTLAPELDGGLDAVRRLTDAGVVAAIGHTDATYDIACAALEAGARVGTHLFNAMRGLHHREPGPIAALLEHPGAYVELVSDGVHVHPAALRLAARAKPDLTVLVTDAMAAAAAADGDYRLGRLTVEVRDGVARLAGSGAIAGSTLTMAAAVKYAVQVAGLPLEDVVRAATAAPAHLIGLDGVGALRPGFRADLVVLDDDLDVQRVLHAGRWIP